MAEPVRIAITDETGELRPLAEIKAEIIREALAREWPTDAARKLGIGRSTLYRKIKAGR